MRENELRLQALRDRVEARLETILPADPGLAEAMRYSLLAGGKRLRPILALEFCRVCGGEPEKALDAACGLEMLHTYSLIHDDLPCMDNDDLRRGKPTNHKVFGEDLAILAGDGLLNSAAEIMARACRKAGARGVLAMETIMRHAGASGMIGGQTEDLAAEGQTPTEETVRYIHLHKTADLLEAPMEAGLLLAGAPEETVALGRAYGEHFGLAFQITDDLLDVVGDAGLLGKNTGMDAELGKMTWVALRGVERAREDARREAEAALEALAGMRGMDTGFFADLARGLLNRTY